MSNDDNMLPKSIEAEEAVLGSILINPDALFEVLPFLKAEDFFIVRHEWIYRSVLDLYQRHDPIDYLTVVQELEQVGHLAEIGGAAYILGLINKTPSALNVEGYGRIVERMGVRRRLIDAAQQVARIAHSDEADIDDVCKTSVNVVIAATAGTSRQRWHPFRTVCMSSEAIPVFRPLLTDTEEIDQVMDLQMGYGRRTSLLGASGTYKTTTLCQIAVEWALQGVVIRFVSMENQPDVVSDKMVRYLAYRDRMTISEARAKLDRCDIDFIGERVYVRDIENSLRAVTSQTLGMLFIDTIQKLMDADSRDGRTASSMASASAAVEGFKLRTGWGVMQAVQQYIESNTQEPAKLRPSRNNVKDAKAIFEDDDNMMGIYCADVWRHEFGDNWVDNQCGPGEVLIRCLKARHGNPRRYKYLKLRVVEGVPAVVSPSKLALPVQQTFAAASHPGNGDGR